MNAATARLVRRGDPRDPRQWSARLAEDRLIAATNQPPELRHVTELVLERAVAAGAAGVALTGSTARGKRTDISDLDYHVVGHRPDISDLRGDVDIYVSDPVRMREKLLSGDDVVAWTLCCGCLLYDTGVFRDAATLLVTHDLWPDGGAKLRRLPELRRLAHRLIAVGDRDAAQDHVRATLTSAARGVLLELGVFALARSELPEQLRLAGHSALADALSASIYAEPTLEQLERSLTLLDPIEITVAA